MAVLTEKTSQKREWVYRCVKSNAEYWTAQYYDENEAK